MGSRTSAVSPTAFSSRAWPTGLSLIHISGIHRVVVGSADPNPLVAGKGIAILRAHGIDVTENVLQEECDALNKVFFLSLIHIYIRNDF